jgi:CRISPR-associated protein Csx10
MELRFKLTLDSDYHISAGHGIGTQVDSALLRDADNIPVLRGSTIEGLLRDGLWRLLQTTGKLKAQFAAHQREEERRRNNRLNEAAAYCRNGTACPLCRIFGTPASPKRWSVSSARPSGAATHLSKQTWQAGQTASQVAARVKINPRQRRAQPRSLFTQEEGDQRLQFEFTVSCADGNETAKDEAALLYAAARMVRRFGSARRRGRGEGRIELLNGAFDESELLGRFKNIWLLGNKSDNKEADKKEWTKEIKGGGQPISYRIIVRADEPIAIARRAEAGNMYDGLDYINASTLWGALASNAATRWRLRKQDGCDYENSYQDEKAYYAFVELLLRGAVSFSPLYPARLRKGDLTRLEPTIPTPLDMLTCKAYPGFKRRELDNHGVHSYATEENLHSKCRDQNAEDCDMPLESLGGMLPLISTAQKVDEAKRSSELHPRINPRTQRVATGDLYGYVALDGGQFFVGEIRCRDKAVWEALCELTGIAEKQLIELRLGKATRRGYGKASVWFEQGADDFWCGGVALDQRVENVAKPITMLLLTGAIVLDAWGRTLQSLNEKVLSELLGFKVEEIRTFCKGGIVDNFNNHLGLPRWRDKALKAGSIIGFKLGDSVDPKMLQDKLKEIERDGIGLRRNEGFGLVAFNHPLCHDETKLGSNSIKIDKALQLIDAPQTGMTKDLKEEERLLNNWRDELQSFKAELFKKEKKHAEQWESIARWLHSAASQSVDEIKDEIDKLVNSELLTKVKREDKEAFTSKETMSELKKWLDSAATKTTSSQVLRRLIEALASHLMAQVKKERD